MKETLFLQCNVININWYTNLNICHLKGNSCNLGFFTDASASTCPSHLVQIPLSNFWFSGLFSGLVFVSPHHLRKQGCECLCLGIYEGMSACTQAWGHEHLPPGKVPFTGPCHLPKFSRKNPKTTTKRQRWPNLDTNWFGVNWCVLSA